MGYDPPHVTVYIGMTADYYCLCFTILFLLHLIALFVMKNYLSDDFQQLNVLDKLLHSAESTSFPFAVMDWDYKRHGGPKQHYERMKKIQLEVVWNIIINGLFNCFLLIPLVYLCKLYIKSAYFLLFYRKKYVCMINKTEKVIQKPSLTYSKLA